MKRPFDIAASVLGLLLLSPILAAVALLVLVKLGKRVLVRQRRPGLNAKPFHTMQVKTMRDATGPDEPSLSDEDRLCRFGKWLRRTGLDELPELWNVLRGDMSLVGPVHCSWISASVQHGAVSSPRGPPGSYRLVQVNGRNALEWEQKFELDAITAP